MTIKDQMLDNKAISMQDMHFIWVQKPQTDFLHYTNSRCQHKYQYSSSTTDYSKPLHFLQITQRTERSLFLTFLLPNVPRTVKTFTLPQGLK